MASPIPLLRRALLYVPGSSPKMLLKSRLLTADSIAYDLEDSVTPAQKPAARAAIRRLLAQPRAPGISEQAVRINAVSSGLALADLTEVLQSPHLDAIVVPKVESAADLHFVADVIRHTLPERHACLGSSSSSSTPSASPPIRLLALIESAAALLALPAICRATPLLSGLVFAAEDFALDLSLTRTPALTEFLYARSAIVTAARAHKLASAIDLVCTAYRGEEGKRVLEEECAGGRGLGFNGKQVIHPAQVGVAQRVFGVGERELEWAVRVVVGDEKAAEVGRGAWTLDGKMVDAPVVGRARAVVERAGACGVDVGRVRERWKGQEPE